MLQKIINKLKNLGLIRFELISFIVIYTVACLIGFLNGFYETDYNVFIICGVLVTINIVMCEIIIWHSRKKYYRYLRMKFYFFKKYTLNLDFTRRKNL